MLRHGAAAMVLVGLLVPAARAEPQTVTVQLVRSIAQAPYYIAVDKGYFAKEGITVQSGHVRSAPYAIDRNLDIAKFENGLRRQEAVHRQHGELNYQGQLSFESVIDASLIHEAAASLK